MKRQKFQDLPITSKLRRLQAISVGLALLFTLLFNGVTQLWREHGDMLADAMSTGHMIGFNVDAAIMFNDSKSATDILSALRGKPGIIAAQIYTPEGNAFAHYNADHRFIYLPGTLVDADREVNANSKLSLTYNMIQPITQHLDTVGYLYFVIDLRPMWLSIFTNMGQISLVMLGAFLLSVLYGQRLAALISKPLIRLSQLAQQVSEHKNYTVRAEGEGKDEIGQLVKSFNQMIGQVQERDAELENHRDRLENEVEARTVDLRKAVLEAQAASVAKSQFLAIMSHEIRTPMNGVLGMTELLLGTELTLTQRQYAETVFSSADLLLTIINDILDFSKIEAGKLELEEIDFKLHDLTDKLIALIFDHAHSKNIELSCEIDPNVPDELRGDPYRLRQILTNLLTNGIKFTEAGSVNLQVGLAELGQCDDPNQVCLLFRVSDTGIGIAPDVLSKLFKSFSQADGSTTRKYGGTGLGLIISKELSELMGGTISVESELGKGTSFIVKLPLRLALASVPVESNQDTDLHGKHVLIVEDNPTDAKILNNHLLSFGMTSRIADNGVCALETLDQAASHGLKYDIALVDMKMVGMNGLELSQHIRHDVRFAKMPIVIITSSTYEGEFANIQASDCDLYLYKPLRKRTLHNALLKVLTKKPNNMAQQQRLQGLRVLLAEDNPVNQEIGRAMLNVMGCEVELAENGQEALAAFKRGQTDLILMDCMMPEMDGYTAAQEIRLLENAAGDSHIPILALTANAMQGDREKCLAAGMSDYLSKPFLQQVLYTKMVALMGGKIADTPPQIADKAHFDPAPLNTLRKMGGDALVSRLLQLFQSNVAEQIETLHQGILAQNNEAVLHAAHSLKSAAANVGGFYLSELARNIENAARNGSLQWDIKQAQNLKAEFEVVLQIIAQQELL
ncbi:MAG: response regulator [Methylococcales bacterium]|nr:response regulator [Methylococcales bacterium]